MSSLASSDQRNPEESTTVKGELKVFIVYLFMNQFADIMITFGKRVLARLENLKESPHFSQLQSRHLPEFPEIFY